ncbi:MAG: Histidinol-phosphatase [Candidatus Dichloromethanomonas elyunquensis]|nr:MAG: Histidinol-phosphatase [Candidatus Dichloromethanomonas elyunquensis]
MIDLHVHLIGHRDRKVNEENVRSFLGRAQEKQLCQIGFSDHDIYWEDLNFNLIREVASEYPELQVRIGMEIDYREEEKDLISKRINAYPFDYLIGSVHQLGGWLFDFPEEEAAHRMRDSDELYRQYFSAVEKAASSGLFDIIGHFDLIKIFKIRPRTDVRKLAERALEAVKDHHLVLEINTNGRYKPVQEFYPELKLIELIHQMEIPFTLGSDAHESHVVGRDLAEVCELLRTVGIKNIQGFQMRERQSFSI